MTAEQIQLCGCFGSASNEALIEYLVLVNKEGHLHKRQLDTIYIAYDLTLAPAIVNVADGDHVPFARLKFELNTVLLLLAAWFGAVAEDETGAHEVGVVADALACAEPVKIWLFDFYVGAAHWIDAKPGRECESVLVRPVTDWWQRNTLFFIILNISFHIVWNRKVVSLMNQMLNK